jgi:hypothetical protein
MKPQQPTVPSTHEIFGLAGPFSSFMALPTIAPQRAISAIAAAKMSEFGKSRATGNLLASKAPKFLGIFVLKTLHI